MASRLLLGGGGLACLHAVSYTHLDVYKRQVNDDASVRRLKGADRPVNSLWQRMRVLAGLSAVDWVVAFGEDTPARLIGAVAPDYLVKGGDNDPAQIPGNRSVWDAGGQVTVMDYIEGCSTTSTIARLLNRT